tara:strand:- start:33510 stop:33695 length:186 start_codon:yes stop_codon:yes gene_type:complete
MTNYKTIVDSIETTRSKNNKNWMDLLRIALKHCPKDSLKVLKKINKNDKKISKLFSQLSKI